MKMTIREAVDTLELNRPFAYGELQDAIDMAIDALKKQRWIPCNERMPAEPDVNPIFEGKRLELYLVSLDFGDYAFRAFWNGRFFTDGWGKLDNVTAWMPLPKLYKQV